MHLNMQQIISEWPDIFWYISIRFYAGQFSTG